MEVNNGAGKIICEQGASERRQPNLNKEVNRAAKIIYDRLWESMVEERDISLETVPVVGAIKGRYAKDYTFPETGWVVSKLLFPDIAATKGKGYHRVAIVASTAETPAGVNEAIKRAYETKTKLENTKAHITADTIIVLTSNISFKEANEMRRVFSDEHRTVFIYSVKNRIGVAKNALKAFANLFTARAQKILALPGTLRDEMQVLAEVLRKRGEKLLGAVYKLTKLLETRIAPKREIKKAKDAAYLYLSKLREWGLRIYVENDEFNDLDTLYKKINYTAQLQGIDPFEMEQADANRKARRVLDESVPKEGVKSGVLRSYPRSRSYIRSSGVQGIS